jgi:hypothetical protein
MALKISPHENFKIYKVNWWNEAIQTLNEHKNTVFLGSSGSSSLSLSDSESESSLTTICEAAALHNEQQLQHQS